MLPRPALNIRESRIVAFHVSVMTVRRAKGGSRAAGESHGAAGQPHGPQPVMTASRSFRGASRVDLSACLPAGFTHSKASEVWSDGTTAYIAGNGTNLVTGRSEALLWIIPAQPCPSNIVNSANSVFRVDVDDLLAVISSWGPCVPGPAGCPADIAPAAGNGLVNVDDLLGVIVAWGVCPS